MQHNIVVHLTHRSYNKKVGTIPVSTSTRDWCPPSCPLSASGCYANSGPVALHWRQVTQGKRGLTWDEFCGEVSEFLPTQLWRHNQAGDLPAARANQLDAKRLYQLVEANTGRRGFTYTHYPDTKANLALIEQANSAGFAINLSANSPAHADKLAAHNAAPVTTLLPASQLSNTSTPKGRPIVVCPTYTHPGVDCKSCQLCQRVERNIIIGFPAHGNAYRKTEAVIQIYK